MWSYSEIKQLKFWCQKVLPLVYDDSLSYYEVLCKIVKKLNELIASDAELKKDIQEIVDWINEELNNLKENAMLPGVNQIQSLPAHSSIYQKQIAVLDKNGQLFGTSININDVMLKPRRPAKNSIAVFDNNGNLCPTCFDKDVKLLGIDDLVTKQENLLLVNRFADYVDTDSWIDFKNGLKIAYGFIKVNLDNLVAAGNIFRQNLTINHGYVHSFNRNPKVTFGAPNNLDQACWVGGATYNQNGILRVTIFSHQQNATTATIPYTAIGY